MNVDKILYGIKKGIEYEGFIILTIIIIFILISTIGIIIERISNKRKKTKK